MWSIEQRVKIVEERMADHSQLFADMRQDLRQFEERVDRRFEQIEARLAALDQKIDTGLAAVNQKIDTGLAAVDQKIDAGFVAVNQRIDAQCTEIAGLRRAMTMHFRWTAGMMFTGMMAIIAAIIAQ